MNMQANPHPYATTNAINSNAQGTPNASSFFNSSPNPNPSPNMNLPSPSSKPMSAMRHQSHGSVTPNLNAFGHRSNGSFSTITNRTCDINSAAFGNNNANIPTTIHFGQKRTMNNNGASVGSTSNANANVNTNANANTNASSFFTQSIPKTLEENHSMHGSDTNNGQQYTTHNTPSMNRNGQGQGYRQEHEQEQEGYDSPALNTAVNLFSKTASALFSTTSAAVNAADSIGGRMGAMRQDFVKMAAPLPAGPPNASALFGAPGGVSGSGGNGHGHGHGQGHALGMSGVGPPAQPMQKPQLSSIHTASDMFQNSNGSVGGGGNYYGNFPLVAEQSPARSVRSAAEMFGQSVPASMPISVMPPTPTRVGTGIHPMRSASPLPPTMRSSSPLPSGNIANASSLFGNVPPSSVRAPTPVPVRAASPASVSVRASSPALPVNANVSMTANVNNGATANVNASSFFGQSSGNVNGSVGASNNSNNQEMMNAPTFTSASDLFGQKEPTSGSTPIDSAVAMFGQTAPPAITATAPLNANSATELYGGTKESDRAFAVQIAVNNVKNARNMFEQPSISVEKPTPPRQMTSTSVTRASESFTPLRPTFKVVEPSPARSTSSLFQRPPIPTPHTASTPVRYESEEKATMASTPVPAYATLQHVTPKSTPITSRPLPQFSKPRLPSPVPRRPRTSPERKNITFSVPNKKPLALPQPKRKDVTRTPFREGGGKSITSVGSGSARSENSTIAGMFRIPPPLQISASPNRTERKKGEAMSPLKSPSSPSKRADMQDTWRNKENLQVPAMEMFRAKESGPAVESIVSSVMEDNLPKEENVQVPVTIQSVAKESAMTNESNVSLAEKVQEASRIIDKPALVEDNIEVDIQPPPPPATLPPLPPGYIELITPDTGIKYYLNVATRVTTWDRPMPHGVQSPLPPSLPKEDKQPSTEVSFASVNQLEEKQPSEEVFNVNKKQSVVDICDSVVSELNRKNTVSKVAQEFITPIISDAAAAANRPNLPPNNSAESTNPEITTDDANIAVGSRREQNTIKDDCVHITNDFCANAGTLESIAVSEQTGLADQVPVSDDNVGVQSGVPEGWVEMIDEASGQAYFFNEVSGIVQWEKPEYLEAFKDNHVVDALADPNLQLESTPDTIYDHFIEEEPLNEHISVEEDLIPENVHKQVTEDYTDNGNASSSLLDGWIEMFDESSGQPYYFNEEEGATQWEKPGSILPDSKDSNQIDEYTHQLEESNDGILDISAAEENATGTAGMTESPERAEISPEYELPEGSAAILIPGWVEMIDETSDQPYYINEVENMTQWEKPVLDAGGNETYESDAWQPENAVEENTEEISIEHSDQLIEDDIVRSDEMQNLDGSNIFDAMKDEGSWQPPLPDAADNLPPGWVQMENESSGQVYFYNEVENVTQWEKPDIPQNEGKEEVLIKETKAESILDERDIHCVPEEEEEDNSSALPAGWEEVVDKASGNVFYSHEANNVTQWETPEEKRRNDSVAVKSQLFDTALSEPKIDPTFDTAVDDHQNSNSEDDFKFMLPAGWVELVDESSGNLYYFNETKNITQWDRPKPVEQQIDAVAPAFVGKEAEDSTKELVTNAGDLNRDETEKVIPKPVSDIFEPLVEDKDEQPLDDSALPGGWVELVDESSGNLYYFNEVENITQWDRPEPVEQHVDAVAPAFVEKVAEDPTKELVANADDLNRDEIEEVIPEPVSDIFEPLVEDKDEQPLDDSALPGGWVELVDESSGNLYYFNEVENITQWDRPEPVEQHVDAVAPASVDASEDPALSDGPILKVFEEIVSEPVSDFEPLVEDKDKKPSDDAAIPGGWVELVDESSGNPYYFNEVENITQWDRPEPVEQHVDAVAPASVDASEDPALSDGPILKVFEEIVSEPVSDFEPLVEDKDKKPSDDAAIPGGWVELVDESSGNPYYFNEVENITQWDKPVIVQDGKGELVEVEPAVEAPASESDPDLPFGWVELTDETSGKVYFYNEGENLTQWKKPQDSSKSIATPKKSSRSDDTSTSQDEWIKVDASSLTKSQTGSVAVSVTSKKNDLPNGWVEVTDPSSGKSYYFNEVENITQWERPECKLEATILKPKSEIEVRPRPPHAIVSFGFGGRFCLMKPQIADSLGFKATSTAPTRSLRKGPIEIYRLSELLPDQHLPSKCSKTKCMSEGPMINYSDSEVLTRLEKRGGLCNTDNELLWNLVAIAARWKGSLRSADGYSNKNGPEAAIVDLLLRNENSLSLGSLISSSFIGKSTSHLDCEFF